MTTRSADAEIGVTGLGVMGRNLARNLARHGYRVAVHNRTPARTHGLVDAHGDEGAFVAAETLDQFVASIARPRKVVVMVKAGGPTDAVIDELVPLLDVDDIVVDGGNAHFEDTRRRAAALQWHGLHVVGAGVSGGEEGALLGPSLMVGGSEEAYTALGPIFETIAAQVDGTPCCAHVGTDGAGHFVKMVHNGIEYADMQLIAEAYDLLRSTLGLSPAELADVFRDWNGGELESFLIEVTAEVLGHRDEATGRAFVDVVVDEAEQKGTGRWTVQSALELGVPVTGIAEAVFARSLSGQAGTRAAARILPAPFGTATGAPGDDVHRAGTVTASGQDEAGTGGGAGKGRASRGNGKPGPGNGLDRDRFVEDVRRTLYASKIVAYAQGFDQVAAGSEQYGWSIDRGELATIWRGGCIIRARFLDRMRQAYDDQPDLATLLVADWFREPLAAAQGPWRRVVGMAAARGIPVPGMASALAYYDGLRRDRLPAALLQGLRDRFGAHTYRRIDRDGSFHTLWSGDLSEVTAG